MSEKNFPIGSPEWLADRVRINLLKENKKKSTIDSDILEDVEIAEIPYSLSLSEKNLPLESPEGIADKLVSFRDQTRLGTDKEEVPQIGSPEWKEALKRAKKRLDENPPIVSDYEIDENEKVPQIGSSEWNQMYIKTAEDLIKENKEKGIETPESLLESLRKIKEKEEKKMSASDTEVVPDPAKETKPNYPRGPKDIPSNLEGLEDWYKNQIQGKLARVEERLENIKDRKERAKKRAMIKLILKSIMDTAAQAWLANKAPEAKYNRITSPGEYDADLDRIDAGAREDKKDITSAFKRESDDIMTQLRIRERIAAEKDRRDRDKTEFNRRKTLQGMKNKPSSSTKQRKVTPNKKLDIRKAVESEMDKRFDSFAKKEWDSQDEMLSEAERLGFDEAAQNRLKGSWDGSRIPLADWGNLVIDNDLEDIIDSQKRVNIENTFNNYIDMAEGRVSRPKSEIKDQRKSETKDQPKKPRKLHFDGKGSK
tara:strand:+ start:3077 stop:4522 length:1446 start_codon:yes stop_codon:yes gene_type:complete